MPTKDDITTFNGSDAMTFNCRACNKRPFASIPTAEVIRGTMNGTLEERAEKIVAEHLRQCTGKDTEA